ncbi:MAG: hypothetical protein Q9181_006216 [Wetmoreana brouardii]
MPNPIHSLWLKWKSLPLPWRKRWLAGTLPFLFSIPSTIPSIPYASHKISTCYTGIDLANNKYYYFRPTLTQKPRRILSPSTRIPYSDVHIPPQWHQWLRQTRPSAPSVQELQRDVQRQEELKQLAAAADARWASKPSVLDAPRRRNQEVGVGDGEGGKGVLGRRGESAEGSREGEGERLREGLKGEDVRDNWGEGKKGRGENPWIKALPKRPGEDYQPESWQPPASTR